MDPRGNIRQKLGIGGILTCVLVAVIFFIGIISLGNSPVLISGASYMLTPTQPPTDERLAEEPVSEEPLIDDSPTEAKTPTSPPVAEPTPEPPAPLGRLVYSLATDEHIQSFPVGTSGRGADILGGTYYLLQAGGPTFTIVDNPLGGNAIRVSGRNQHWYALDISLFMANALNLSANTYTITVSGTASAGAMVRIGGMDAPWNVLYTTFASMDGSFSVSGTISTAALSSVYGGLGQFTERGFRIQTDDFANFTVYEIIVTEN